MMLPYWRLSAFYFFYFGSVGALSPYWSLYLDHLGFSARQIGELMASLMAARLIAPFVWGWIADLTGDRMRVVRWGTFMALIAFCGVFLGQHYWWMVVVTSAFSFFWNAALPQFEAATLNHLGHNSHRYSHIRIWGSFGFIVVVMAVGTLLDHVTVDVVPSVLLLLFAGIWLASLFAPKDQSPSCAQDHPPVWRVMKRPEVVALFLVCFLMQMSHGPYYTFYSLYLERFGYTRAAIGQLWALGVVAEVVVFVVLHRVLAVASLKSLLMVSLALTAVRWVLIALYPAVLPLLVFAQLLHAASFGIYHAVAIQFVHKFFVGRNQGRGQALYSSLGFGAGGAAGSLYSGYLWDSAGPNVTFFIAAVIVTLAWVVAWRGLAHRYHGEAVETA